MIEKRKKKAYVFLADGFEEVEALCPFDLLLRSGIDAVTVSINTSEKVVGTHKIAVLADITADKLPKKCDADLMVLPGGMPGTAHLASNETVVDYIRQQMEAEKYIGAICAAPSILGDMGLMNGKRAICFPGFERYMHGAEIVNEKVVRDGNIVTSIGMGAAFDFGLELVSILCGKETADELAKASKYILV